MTYYQEQTIIDQDVNMLERINAMLLHEEKNAAKNNNNKSYSFTSEVNASHRKAMIDWCYTVCDAFNSLQRETVTIAASILDRYLASSQSQRGCDGESVTAALMSRQRFQLAAITCFYVAVKTYEDVALSLDMLIKLCRGYYTEQDIMAMELEILDALEWRISLSTATPMDYVRHFLELLPESTDVADSILKNATRHMENATSNTECTACKTSSIGVVCFAGALNDTFELSTSERNVLWQQLSSKLVLLEGGSFDIASTEIRSIEMKLLITTEQQATNTNQFQSPRGSLVHKDVVNLEEEEQPSSPVSVMQM